MASPGSSSKKSKQPADQPELPKEDNVEEKEAEKKEAQEEQPPPSVDPRLLNALQNPKICPELLRMESQIKKLMANPDSKQVTFPQCQSKNQRKLANELSILYALECDRTEPNIVYVRKKPVSRIPSITLSDIIAKSNPKGKLTIPIKKGSAGASSSNMSAAQETTETKNTDRTADEPEKDKDKKKKPLAIDKRLADGVEHPQFGKILLTMEARIQEAMQNPNSRVVEYPRCSSGHLKKLADLLSQHYGLEFHGTKGIKVFATKKPDSRIPSVTLSDIAAKSNPKGKLTITNEKDSAGASSSSNICAPEITIPEEEGATKILEEREDLEPNCNMSAPELTESEKKDTMVYAQEITEAEKREEEEETPINNLSAQEKTESEKDDRNLEEREEEEHLVVEERDEDVESPILVDPRLADAVQDPQVRNILLSIEAKIQQGIQDPNLPEVEFPECSSPHLVTLSSILALHYGLEPHYRVHATKKPESRIPSVTLSGIIPKVSSSTSPVASRLVPPAISDSTSPVVVSNSIPPVVESSTLAARLSPIIFGSISPEMVSNAIPTEAVTDQQPQPQPQPQPQEMQNTETVSQPATTSNPQEMQYTESAPPYMLTPYGNYNVYNPYYHPYYASEAMHYPNYPYYAPGVPVFTQQPPPVQYGTQPYQASGGNLAYSNYPYDASEVMNNPAYSSSIMQSPLVQNMATYDASGAMYNPAYPSYNQRPPVQNMATYIAMSGGDLAYLSSMFNPANPSYNQRPPVQNMATYNASEAMNNPAFSRHNRWRLAQYTQSVRSINNKPS